MTLLKTLVLFALVSCFINCCNTKECIRKKDMKSSRRFPISQRTDPMTNKSINTLNYSSMQHLNSKMTTMLLPCFYLVVLVIGLPANGLALWILITRIKKLPAIIFLMNLAVTDLLLILTLPLRVSYYLLGNDWVFGEVLCRVCSALFYGNICSSILFLTCISADRYLAIVHPFSKEFRNKGFVYCICGAVWVVVLLSMLPIYIFKQSYKIDALNITTCNDALPEEILQSGYGFYYYICLAVFGFVIPCLITVFCHVSVISTLILNNEKYVHVIKVTLLVLLVFLVCLTPFHVIILIYSYTRSSDIYAYSMFCLVLSTCNNCIDPFIYYYISEEFRDKVRDAICTPKKETSSGKSAQSFIQSSSASQPSSAQSV